MKAIIGRKVIEMNKAEAKAAGTYGTAEFEELANLRKEFPNFRIVTKASKSKDNMKGLDTKFMEKYIKEHDTTEDKSQLKEFYSLRGLDAEGKEIELARVATYGELKMWFLSVYPEAERIEVNEILAKAKKIREAQKTARKAA